MRANTITILLLILAAALAACSSGKTPQPAENACPTQIIDDTYTGSYRAVLGFGEGAQAALRLAFARPGRFNVVAALDGPVDACRLLADFEDQLKHFDNWPASPSRPERIAYWRDLLGAFGNPLFEDYSSAFYPPGLDAGNFSPYDPLTLPGIITPDNPDGSLPSVTVLDVSGTPIDYLLAVDLNRNGVRDEGEPIIVQMHEPFQDLNGDGCWEPGEPFDDVGLDGVAGTGDYGEGNGEFDYHPLVANWLANDPISLARTANLNLEPGYEQSYYLDALTEDPFDDLAQMSTMADVLSNRLQSAAQGTDFCIANQLGRFDAFLSNVPVLEDILWFDDKDVYFQLPGDQTEIWSDDEKALRIARWSQALNFISDRMPNGLIDNVEAESPAVWQVQSFFSETVQRDVEFGVGLPAGYFDGGSSWKSYPVIYVFHDRASTIHDWYELLERQGDLAHRLLARQAIIVVIDGSREVDGHSGYGYYLDQAADEIGGDYGALADEVMNYVEATFRVQVSFIDH